MASQSLISAVNSYDNYIQRKGIDEQVIDAYIEACRVAINGEKDITYGLQITNRSKGIIERFCMERTGGTIWDLEKYSFANKTHYSLTDKLYDALLLEAQNKVVDSAYRYLEKKREPRERFYMPRRKQFLKIGLMDAIQGMIDDKYDILCVSLIPGAGKTTVEKMLNALVAGWFPRDFNLFYSHSGDITRMYYDGVYDICTNSDEYTWNEIFPNLSVTSTNAKMEQFNIGKYKPFPSVQCTSVGSKNAGKVRASKFLFVDDMIGGIEEAMNPIILDKLWDKYAVDARQRKTQDTDGKNCKEIHIATRWSVNDVIGRIQNMYEGNPRVKVIAVPDIDPKTGLSNFDYEFSGFTVAFLKINNYSWMKSLIGVFTSRSLLNVRDCYSRKKKSDVILICHMENRKLLPGNAIPREKEPTFLFFLYCKSTEKIITAWMLFVTILRIMRCSMKMLQMYLLIIKCKSANLSVMPAVTVWQWK